jgi:hypothetical protein
MPTFRLFVKDHFPEPTLNPSGAILMGIGTSSAQATDSNVDKNWLSFYLSSSGATGTTRGMYLRTYLTGGAGGEAIRAMNTVSAAAPVDTVNGAHISLNFGSSAGNVTGEGQAVRATLQLGNRSMTGTLAAVKAELWADGTSTDVASSQTSFMRFSLGGNATGAAKVDTSGFFFTIDGLTANTDKLLRAAAPTTLAASLRCKVGATTYYLPLYSAPA